MSTQRWFRAVMAAASLLLVAGCGGERTQSYETQGTIRELRPDGRTAVVHHDDIPGYMKSMTMPIAVRDTNLLTKIRIGDRIAFALKVTARDGWMENIRVIGREEPSPASPASSNEVNILPNVPALQIGEVVPDLVFTNQLGRAMNLRDLRGQAVAFTFIFTRCPFPTFCPRVTEHFGEIQKDLKSPGTARNWHLLTVSFDPEYDTPERLREYGEKYQHDPGHWSLVSGSFDSISRLAGHFELYFGRNLAPEKQNHNLRTVVLDTQGRVHRIFMGNEWSPAEVATSLREAMVKK